MICITTFYQRGEEVTVSEQLADWRSGRTPFTGWSLAAKRDEDSIFRLQLPARTTRALLFARVATISLLVELADLPERPEIYGVGAAGWRAIEYALSRPLPPVEQEVAS